MKVSEFKEKKNGVQNNNLTSSNSLHKQNRQIQQLVFLLNNICEAAKELTCAISQSMSLLAMTTDL